MTLPAYGLTSVGWFAKPLAVVAAEVDAALQVILGRSAGSNPDGTIPLQSFAGQLKTMIVDAYADHWDKLTALSTVSNPAQASDAFLDNIGLISGVRREGAQFSTVTITCTGTPGTVLTVGRVVVTADASASQFDSVAALNLADPAYPASTIVAVSLAWATNTSYVLGQRVTNAGNVYQCAQSGASAASAPGPTGTTPGALITDNGAKWVFLGAGAGAVDVPFVAATAGPIGAVAYSLTSIATPVAGWSSAANALDAVPGRIQENDVLYRARRDAEQQGSGNATVDAIRAHVLAVNQGSTDSGHLAPTSVRVLFNDTDATDAHSLPPHSVKVIVVGGTDQDIALAVWQSVDAATNTVGNVASTVLDSEGNPQTVHWHRPTAIPIYVTMTVYYDASKWPATGAAALVQQAATSAVTTFGLTFPVGQSVRALPIGAAVVDGPSAVSASGAAVIPAPAGSPPAPGILDVTPIFIGTAPSPGGSSPITIAVDAIAQFESVNVVVTAVAAVP